MAVLGKCAAPESVKIEVFKLESIIVRWSPPENAAGKYCVRVQYFDPYGPMVSAFLTTEQEVYAVEAAKEFKHPEEVRDGPAGLKACTVRVTIASVIGSPQCEGEAATCQTTWDSKQRDGEAMRGDRDKHMAVLCRTLQDYTQEKRTSEMSVLVIGRQHHGKSSFINHLHRTSLGHLDRPDEMESAPAGMAENTLETKSLVVPFPYDKPMFKIRFVDTPAFSSLETMGSALDALLATSFREGARREHMTCSSWWPFDAPPDAAICVLSLMQWVSMKRDQQTFLETMARKFKSASGGKVCFPYVVAVTHRDEFLKDTTAEHPTKQLHEIVQEIKDYANTESVFVVANMKQALGDTLTEPSYWSKEVSWQTFELLRSIVTFARNADTGVAKQEMFMFWARGIAFAIIVAVVSLGLAVASNAK